VVESLLAKPFYHDGGFCFSVPHTRSRIFQARGVRQGYHVAVVAVADD
jgi:hypothetical protein